MEDEIKKLQEVQPLIYDIDKTVDAVLKKYPNFGQKIAQKWAKAREQFKNKKLSLYEKAFQEARSREVGQQMNTVPELLPQPPEQTMVQPQSPEQPPLTPQAPVSLETQQPTPEPGPQIAPIEKDLSAASAFEAGIGQAGGVVGSVNKFAETYIKGVLGEWLPKDKIGKTGSERIKEWARIVENGSNFDRKAMDEMAWYDPQKFALTAIEMIPQLGVFGASTAINPALGFAVMGAAEGGEAIDRIEQYEKATGEKVPDGVKYTAPIIVGVINGFLERTGIERALKGLKIPGNIRRRLADIAISMAVEGLTEGTQSAIQSVAESGYAREANTLMEYITNAGDQLEQDWQQILQEAYAGIAGGGGMSALSNIGGAAMEGYADRQELKDAQKSGERIGDTIFSKNIGQRPQSDRARGMQEGDVIDLNGGLTDLQREAASQGIPVTNKKGEFISDNVLRRILSDRKKRTGNDKGNAGNAQGQAQQPPESGKKKPSAPAKEVKAFKDVAESTGTPLKTEDGKPLSERYFRYHIRQRLKEAGISDEVISEMTPAAINEVLKRRPDLAKPLPLPEPKKKTKSIDEIASPDAVKVRKKRAKRTFSDENLRGYIANIGGIRTQDLKDREITNRADASIFFKIGRREGQHIDELAESLINDGVIPEPPSAYNPSEWLMKLIREDAKTNFAGEQQQTEIDNQEAEYYYEEYGKNAIIGDDIDFETFKKMWSAKIEPETVHTGSLEKGDTFTIAGEQYRVVKETDDELTIKNGDTKTVDAIFGTLTIDKGSLNNKKEAKAIAERAKESSSAKEAKQTTPKKLPNGIINYIRGLKSNKKKAYASQYAKYKLGMIDKEPGTDLSTTAKQSVRLEVDKRLKPGYEEEFATKQAKEQGADATKKQTMRTKLENRAKMEEKRRRDKARGQEDIFDKAERDKQKDLFKEPDRDYNIKNQEIRYEKKGESALQERQGRAYVPEGREGKRSKTSTRKLQSGEFQKVERKYRTYKQLKFFAGKEIVSSPEDVAFIFKQLEQEAVEHFFVLHIPKSGKPIVQHMSSGTYNSSLVEPKVMNDSMERFGTKEIYIVHNHPSGKVIASESDIQVYKKLKRIVEQRNVKMNEGIIIDTRNPVYGTFNSDIEKNRENLKTAKYTDKIKLNAITFSRKVYKSDAVLESVTNPGDVASYISAQRFSEGNRSQLLSMDNANHVIGRFFIEKPYNLKEISSLVTRSGGSRAIIVSNKEIEADDSLRSSLEDLDIELLDYITVKNDGSYTSARGAGTLRESKADYVKEKDINDYNGSSVNYDKGGYGYINPSIIQMPEMIEILNDLLDGRLPTVKENLGKALGLFSTEGYIKLRADLFKDPELALRVLSHEVGHVIDWLSDKTLKRGNILGRMASLKSYMKHLLEESPDSPYKILTQKDRNRLRKEAREQLRRDFKKGVKEIIEEVTVEVPIFKEYNFTAKEILNAWNDVESRKKNPDLHDFIATLSSDEKKAIMVEAMKGVINEKVQKEFTGKKQVGTEKVTKTTRTTIEPDEVTPENIRKRYRELLEREIDKRKLFTLERVTDQLKAITHIIKPFDSQADPEYTKYRYSSKELYADAISVLFNDPVLLRELAPDFYKGFFNYLERKPEVKRIYTEIMKRIEDPILKNENREKNIEKMQEKGEERAIKAAMMEKAGTMSFIAMIKRGLGNEAQRLTEQKKKKKKKGTYDPEKDPEIALEELAHVDGPVYNYLNALHHGIQKKMEALNISETEFGKFLFLKRVTGDRAELANPLGFTLKDALELLSYLKDKMGREEFDETTAALTELYKDGQALARDKFEALEALADEFRRIREKHIIPEMEKADMYSDDLMKRIKDDKTYVTFNVQHYMDKKYGAVASGRIYKQIGTFNDIINPFTATVMKDASLLRSIKRKRAAVLVEEQFKEITPDEIEKAKPVGKGEFARAPQGMELVTYLDKGKLRGYYIPKDIANILNSNHNAGGEVMRKFYSILQFMTVPFKSIFVSHNPFWAARNLIRDVTGAATRIPEAGLLRMWYHTIKAMPDAARDVFLQQSSPMVKRLYKEGVLIVGREYHRRADQDGETLLSAMMADWRLQNKKSKNVWKRFVVPVWESLATLGQLTERAVKIGSANLIYESRGKLGKQEIHMLRHLAGSPDFYNKGELFMLYNGLFLFSNAGMQGLRANVESFKESPRLFSRQFRHSYMFKTILYVVIPKIMVRGAMLGLLTPLLRMIWGDDGEEYGKALEKALKMASDYTLQNYIPVPVGFDSNGKAILLKIPMDFNGQIIGGIMWRMLQDDPDLISKFSSLFDYTMGGLPYSGLNPIIGLASDAIEYNAFGNIYDSYFGNMVLPKSVAEEGKYSPRALSYLSRYYYNKMGLRNLYRLDYAGPKEEKGKIEKIGKIPLIGPGFRSFVSITDRGVTDRLEKAAKTAKQEEARARNDARERILNHINEIDRPTIDDMRNLYKSMKEEGFEVGLPTDFKRKYQMFAVARFSDNKALMRALSRNNSKKVQRRILMEYFKTDDIDDIFRKRFLKKAKRDVFLKQKR